MALTGTGRIALTPQYDAELTFRFHDTSLDPYVRLFVPKLSPFTTAVASGAIRVVGELADRSPGRRRHRRHAGDAAARLRGEERGADPDRARRAAGQDRRSCSSSARTRGCASRERSGSATIGSR
jgi:hypothetical protein